MYKNFDRSKKNGVSVPRDESDDSTDISDDDAMGVGTLAVVFGESNSDENDASHDDDDDATDASGDEADDDTEEDLSFIVRDSQEVILTPFFRVGTFVQNLDPQTTFSNDKLHFKADIFGNLPTSF